MAMTNEQLTKWIDEIFGTIDEIKTNSGDITTLTRTVKQQGQAIQAAQEDISDLEDQTAGVVSLPKAALQHFTDGSATQALDMLIDIVPVQAGSGDPSPTNVRAISGYSSVTGTATGKNLLDPTLIKQGGIVSDSGVMYDSDTRCYCDYKKVTASTDYVASVENDKNILAVHFYSSDNSSYWIRRDSFSNLSEVSFTTPENCSYIRLVYGYKTDAAIIPANITQAQIELGEEATTYEAYQANTATLSLGRTIYGGSADFTTGAETETLVAEDIGTSANITWEDAPALHAQGVFPFTISGADYASQSWMAEKYKTVYGTNWEVENGQIKVTVTAGGSTGCRLCDTTYTSLEALKTALTGSKLIHPITTPNTYTTTTAQLQLLEGENNVSANSGDITLTYAPNNVLAEVYAYIQKRFDTLAAALTANRTTRKTTKTLTKKED